MIEEGLIVRCDECGRQVEDGETFWECKGKIVCEDCLPPDLERIGERH